jgi:hypothetical protein
VKTIEFASETDARAELDRLDNENGYPDRNLQVTPGRHVDQDAPHRPGWTLTTTVLLAADDGTAALVVDEVLEKRVAGTVTSADAKWAAVWATARGEQPGAAELASGVVEAVLDAEFIVEKP